MEKVPGNQGLAKVTVYAFSVYNLLSDSWQLSSRMGTLDTIKNTGGIPFKWSGIEVDTSVLSLDYTGMTNQIFDDQALLCADRVQQRTTARRKRLGSHYN